LSVQKPGVLNGEWQIRTDGAARGNPGPAGVGVVLVDPGGAVVDELAKGIGWATNNVAEYQALIDGLRLARSHGVDRLAVFSDSTLLVEQMKGRWKVKHAGLLPLYGEARRLLSEFDRWSARHVRRAENFAADALCNEAIDRALSGGPASVVIRPAA